MSTIHKDVCPECNGTGHHEDCVCKGGIGFIMGCCAMCCGEGFVNTLPPHVEEITEENFGKSEK